MQIKNKKEVNALLELHDLIPYLFSMSIICTFAYAAYFVYQSTDDTASWPVVQVIDVPHRSLLVAVRECEQIQHWLVRRIKRKESPDGDLTDCPSSFVHHQHQTNKRGGFLWSIAGHSFF